MRLQFFHVEDLCRFIEILLDKHPAERIYNVGNPDAVTICEWVKLCYGVVGADLETIQVEGHPQRAYFCFHDYDYYLDVSKQMALMLDVTSLAEGLRESYEWFCQHRDAVMRRPYMEYISEQLR